MKKIILLLAFIATICSCTKIEDVQNSIRITKRSLSKPNSVGGCDATIGIKNISGKTIKYIEIEMMFFNAVGDQVKCEIGGYYHLGKVTGPIKPGEHNYYTWECPIYNYSARSVGINYVLIEYMDGTELEITDRHIQYIL